MPIGSVVSLSSSAASRSSNEAQANDERDKATRNFKLAQQAAETLVFDIARGLRNVQGVSAETIRKILDTARASFEQLAAAAPDDPALQRSQSVMLGEFGDTYQILGDLDAALRAYRDGLAIMERLGAPTPAIRCGRAICRSPTTRSVTC